MVSARDSVRLGRLYTLRDEESDLAMHRDATVGIPPNPPWLPVAHQESGGGYLSYFYSDDLSRLPVRAVTRIGDNKADPNLETKTYGLFSLCNKRMRKSIVNRGCRHIFFMTNRKGTRVLVGLYFVKWFTPIAPGGDDFCLAADGIWFIEDPIPLTDVDRICGTTVARWFRTYLHIEAEECRQIERLLKSKADTTGAYLAEIDRLERFNAHHSGYRYVSAMRTDPYSWHSEKVASILRKVLRSS